MALNSVRRNFGVNSTIVIYRPTYQKEKKQIHQFSLFTYFKHVQLVYTFLASLTYKLASASEIVWFSLFGFIMD